MGFPPNLFVFPKVVLSWIKARPRLSYGLLVVFVILSSWLSEGWLQPDEHARAFEPAHQLVYGFASLPWEFNPQAPLVSYLLGALYSPVLWFTKAWGASGLTEAALCRVLTGLVAVSRIYAFFLLLKPLGLKLERRITYTLLYLFGPLTLVLLPRTTQENWSTTGMLWGAVFLMYSAGTSRRRANILGLGGGVLLALATSFRLQNGFSCLGLGLWALFQGCSQSGTQQDGGKKSWAPLGWMLVGGAVGLVPMALVDTMTYGVPFKPALHYLQYALHDEEGGNLWGRNPWTDYLYGFLGLWYPPFSLIVLPLILWGALLAPVLGWVLVPHLVVHLTLSHKELRYLSPLIPFWTLAFFLGLERLEAFYVKRFGGLGGQQVGASGARLWSWLGRCGTNGIHGLWRIRKSLVVYFYGIAILHGVLAFVTLNPQPRFYQTISNLWHRGEMPTPFGFVANSRSGLSQFYLKDPAAQPQQKLEIGAFIDLLDQNTLPLQTYVLQRVPIELLSKVEAKCHGIVSSMGLWQRRIYLHPVVGPWIRFRYFDGVYHCPSA